MKKLATTFSVMLAALALSAGAAFAQIQLSELRLDQPGTDVDEYVELSGPVGASLTGLTLVVIGDGTGGCGVVEQAIDLSAFSIQADGFFALRFSSGVPLLAGYDATLAGSFENSDNITFLLVTGSTAAAGNDLDIDNNGTLDLTPWSGIVDQVALNEGTVPNCTTEEFMYSPTQVGPDGSFVPGHIYRCGSAWYIGIFDPMTGVDTPGSGNTNCAVPTTPSTWGKVKSLYR